VTTLRHHLAEVGAFEHFHGLEEHAVGLTHFKDTDQVWDD